MPDRTVQKGDEPTFHGYVRRHLSDSYRLAAMTLDNPIQAQEVVHEAIVSGWQTAKDGSGPNEDQALESLLDVNIAAAIRRAAPDAASTGTSEGAPDAARQLEAALAGLSPETQLSLLHSFGPWESDPAASATAPSGADALRTLAARVGGDTVAGPTDDRADDLGVRLRALYEARDPGVPAPLPLRMRLQQDEDQWAASETKVAAVRARRQRRSGWAFGLNAFLGLAVLIMAIALASVVDVRASAVASADPTGDPASPLTIAGVAVVQGNIVGPDIHVGATQRTLIATFPSSPVWHASDRQCLADVVGTINWDGTASWLGQRAGHVDTLAGDPSSMSAYAAGLGSYCQNGLSVSFDGGVTWSLGPLPGDPASNPTWLGFDPARAHTLLAYTAGALSTSSDSGAKWTTRQSNVEPLAFDSTGRLVGWTASKLLESSDDGASWQETGPGPAERPVTVGATSSGAFIGAPDGLWWYPLTAAPSRVRSGNVFSITTLGEDALVLGADAVGHPWLGTVNNANPGFTQAALPPELGAMEISGGAVAANDSGAVAAFSGVGSAIALVTFAY
jgi:hypothetical protein